MYRLEMKGISYAKMLPNSRIFWEFETQNAGAFLGIYSSGCIFDHQTDMKTSPQKILSRPHKKSSLSIRFYQIKITFFRSDKEAVVKAYKSQKVFQFLQCDLSYV